MCFLSLFPLLTDPPSISDLPPNTVIQEGKNVTLYCNVTGNPSPKITWTKDGSVKVLSGAERFIILNVTRQQAGDYVCTARNGMGTSANTTLMLTVHCRLHSGSIDSRLNEIAVKQKHYCAALS